MNKRIRDGIFFLLVFFLIFNNIPKPVQLSFLGGPAGGKLSVYPLLAGFLYSFYCQYKDGGVFSDFKRFARYIAVFIGVMLLSTVVGLITYPYYDLVLNGPVDQIEKLPRVLAFLSAHGIEADAKLLMQMWIVARQIKAVFLEAFWCFGGAYLIYCWYRIEWERAVKILTQAVMASAAVLIGYSVVEVFWLAHCGDAEWILKVVNPFIHTIKGNEMWWPPLLWNGQLRSVFAEPSYYGIYMAFAMPWLWNKLCLTKSKVTGAVIFLLAFGIVLTRARTAFMIHVGELSLLVLFCLLFARNEEALKRVGKIFVISLCAFLVGTGFISQYMDKGTGNAKKEIVAYIESNATSLKNLDARSNRARYSVMEADIRVGMDYPVLGVGSGLRSSYVVDYFSGKALENGEVKMWLRFRENLGIMRVGIPKLGEYTSKFSETGILGMVIFFFPAIMLFWGMYKKLQEFGDKWPYVMFLISFCGIMATGIGDTLNITFAYWILLGLGYAIVFGRKNNTE